MGKFKILTILGARPQFIKASVVSNEFAKTKNISEIILHTGQHFDENMSGIFFSELSLKKPNINLNINSMKINHMLSLMIKKIDNYIIKKKPDVILVYGDTTSTLAGAIAAANNKKSIIHIEAGLRSNFFFQPEEINRKLTDSLSEVLFCPTKSAQKNLVKENNNNKLIFSGDVMYDIALIARKICPSINFIKEKYDFNYNNYNILTIHRAENIGFKKRLIELIDYVRHQSRKYPIIMPVHPSTNKQLKKFNISLKQITLIPPLSYLEMTSLLLNSKNIFTDSGGLQKEAYFHNINCITLREQTEWIETIDLGFNRLWKNRKKPKKIKKNIFGNGQSAKVILDSILKIYNI